MYTTSPRIKAHVAKGNEDKGRQAYCYQRLCVPYLVPVRYACMHTNTCPDKRIRAKPPFDLLHTACIWVVRSSQVAHQKQNTPRKIFSVVLYYAQPK